MNSDSRLAIQEGWERKRLIDVLLALENGGRPKGGVDYIDDGVPSIGGEHISKDGGFIFDNIKFIPREFYDGMRRGRIEKGDVLLVKDGATTGKVSLVREDYPYMESAVNEHVFICRPNKKLIIPEYLFYHLFCSTGQNQVLRSFHGAAQGGINTGFANDYIIPIPPLETQRNIVAILEKAEETKGLRAQADEYTNQLLQSFFLEMFGDPVKNPKKWKIIELHDLAEIVSGVTKGRKLSGNSVVLVPYLRVANVQDGYLDLNEVKTIEALPSEVEKYALLEGDVLLTEGGDPDKLGRGAVWYNEIPNCIHQNHIFRVRVDKESIVPEFLSMLIGSAYGKMYFLKSAKQTTGIATINSTQLKNFPVFVPPIELQQKFTSVVEKVESMRKNQNKSKQHIEDLFNTMMQKAFKGELWV